MNYRVLTILVSAFALINSCTFNKCENIDGWMNDAPEALKEFNLVKREILSNSQFQKKFSVQGQLFIRILDTSEYKSYDMPSLKEWFRKGRGYIAFTENDTSFCFKECESGVNTSSGYIYYRKKKNEYKTRVQIVDSLDLGEGWHAEIVKCKGCNE